MKTAVVLVNLGTPEQPTPSAVRRFLRQFLSDPRVVEVPKPVWLPILYGIILPFRPKKVAQAYAQLWRDAGDSPLRLISERQVEKLRERLTGEASSPVIRRAVCYGEPGLSACLDELMADGVEQLLIFPLYPQYSATTTAAVYDQFCQWSARQRKLPSVTLLHSYHDNPDYIDALAQSVEAHWRQHGQAQRLLLSYHGIPQRNVDLGDPYREHCERTARLLAERLQLRDDQWAISFQSRLGRAQWLQPYTIELLQAWGEEKLASVDVICPAFSVDCLETLEEIDIENRGVFTAAGGGEFRYIPCLNDSDAHIDMMLSIIRRHLSR